MKSHLAKFAAVLALAVAQAPASAEDIDLFVQPAGTSSDIPNILFMVDNTANWNTMFANEVSALVNTFNSLSLNTDGTAKFRVGVMFATETGNPNDNNSGAYVRAAIRPMNATNRGLYATMFNTLDVGKDTGNAGKSGLEMVEAYRYFSGGAPYAGNNKVKTDYTGNDAATWKTPTYTAASKAAMLNIYGLGNNALSSLAGTRYNSPIPNGYCGRNYIIYISNGPNQESASDDTAANNALTAAGGSITQIGISPVGSASNPSDEWARFMYGSSLGVVTYTLDVYTDASKLSLGQWPGWTALLKSMAAVSTGKYFLVNGTGSDIGNIIGEILSEIQAVNSVFASVSLPVSVNTEGTYLDQVYIGMFRPDQDAFPRWAGNLKQYKLGYNPSTDTTTLRLLDADGNRAISSAGTGFIAPCARSYWTPTTVDSYWGFRPQGDCTVVANSKASNYPDGQIVEKGGQAYKLRGTTTRTFKTCSSTFASCTSLVDFNSTNVSQGDLGAANTAERDALIAWAKGLDVDDENVNAVTATTSPAEMRPSAHGDVVHSRPIAINFGPDVSPKVVVVYGGNDGVLRAINANQTDDINSTTPGSELWAFVPPQFDAQFKRLRDNTTQINFKGNTTTTPPPLPKPYGMDGPVTAYTNGSLNTPPTIAWIYGSMRRGGRVLYAFDMSGIAASPTPTAPSLKWKIGCPSNFPTSGTVDDTGCDAAMVGLGQTWSSPKVLKSAGYNTDGTSATAKPMLIMGGGYDTCEDIDASTKPTCISSEKGNKVYVLDADYPYLSGSVTPLNTFTTDQAVVADVFVVPDRNTGLARWAYVVDLGGNVYRISGANAYTPILDTAPGSWTMTKIASLGCSTPTANCWPRRKFMFAPDVVEEPSSTNTFYLLVGSGDREKPLRAFTNTLGNTNYFFMIKDVPTNTTWLTDEIAGTGTTGGNCGAAVLCLDSLLSIPLNSATPSAADVATKKGWYLGLAAGEQVVTSAITVYGTTTFSTHIPANPAAGACTSNLGDANVYNINFRTAAPANGTTNRSQPISGGGLPPSPVAGQVKLDNGRVVPFCIGCNPASPLEGGQPTPPSTTSQPKSLTYWFIRK